MSTYFKGAVSGTYRTSAFNKSLILTTDIALDGWKKGVEKIQGSFSAFLLLKHSKTESFSLGLYSTTLFTSVPVVPIIAYTHRFSSAITFDAMLPSSAFLRCQLSDNHRVSIGAAFESEEFYLNSSDNALPSTGCFYQVLAKPELVYEYIVDKHFYLVARAGGSAVVKGGVYDINRKGIDDNPYLESSGKMKPFFYLGFSYNIF